MKFTNFMENSENLSFSGRNVTFFFHNVQFVIIEVHVPWKCTGNQGMSSPDIFCSLLVMIRHDFNFVYI